MDLVLGALGALSAVAKVLSPLPGDAVARLKLKVAEHCNRRIVRF